MDDFGKGFVARGRMPAFCQQLQAVITYIFIHCCYSFNIIISILVSSPSFYYFLLLTTMYLVHS